VSSETVECAATTSTRSTVEASTWTAARSLRRRGVSAERRCRPGFPYRPRRCERSKPCPVHRSRLIRVLKSRPPSRTSPCAPPARAGVRQYFGPAVRSDGGRATRASARRPVGRSPTENERPPSPMRRAQRGARRPKELVSRKRLTRRPSLSRSTSQLASQPAGGVNRWTRSCRRRP